MEKEGKERGWGQKGGEEKGRVKENRKKGREGNKRKGFIGSSTKEKKIRSKEKSGSDENG